MAPTKPAPTAQPSTPRAARQATLAGSIINKTPDGKRMLAISPQSSQASPRGRAKGSTAGSGGKYGRCPECMTGRRQRGTCHPFGPNAGKFRFICSNRKGDPPCNYSEILASDPAENPAAYSGAAQAPTPSLSQSIKIEDDDEEEEKYVADDDVFTTSAPKNLHNKTKPKHHTASLRNMNKNLDMGAGKDEPEQKLGCPQCMQGVLVKKRRDTFRYTETILVCEKTRSAKDGKVVGGCGYSMDISSDPADGDNHNNDDNNNDEEEVEVTKVVKAPAAIAADKAKAKKTRVSASEREKEMYDFVALERQRALKNPHAAAVMVGPPMDKIKDKPKKKVVVDLTSDDEFLGIAPGSKPMPPAGAIGAHAPIVIDDDEEPESKPTAEFEDLDEDDELELIQLADKAVDDDLDEDDELELIEMTDKAAAAMSSQ